ncbi:MAG: GNAT family N-acetyltransferase [Clostridia bacterium]|nr:GNAT family N-acetyltransferase [Clostridia bacterium]
MRRFCIAVALSLIISGNAIVFGEIPSTTESGAFDGTTTLSGDASKHEQFENSLNANLLFAEQENAALLSLSNKLGLSYGRLVSIFSFNISDKRCSLVPICDCKEHLNCFLNIFSYSDPNYIQHYRNGELMPESYVEQWFHESVKKMSQDHLQGITLLIKIEGKVIGRIGIGPFNDGKRDLEIGYALQQSYSGQGIMSKAVAQAICFLHYLRSEGDTSYNFEKLRATAKKENIASNKILMACGFMKSNDINTSYGPRQEYFYYF